jgi:hypothetical protein
MENFSKRLKTNGLLFMDVVSLISINLYALSFLVFTLNGLAWESFLIQGGILVIGLISPWLSRLLFHNKYRKLVKLERDDALKQLLTIYDEGTVLEPFRAEQKRKILRYIRDIDPEIKTRGRELSNKEKIAERLELMNPNSFHLIGVSLIAIFFCLSSCYIYFTFRASSNRWAIEVIFGLSLLFLVTRFIYVLFKIKTKNRLLKELDFDIVKFEEKILMKNEKYLNKTFPTIVTELYVEDFGYILKHLEKIKDNRKY